MPLEPFASIVAVCGDAGGAAAVGPVIARLRASSLPVRALAYGQARDAWTRARIDHEPCDEHLDAAAIRDLLRSAGAELLLAGTSLNSIMLERRFTAAAHALAIPSLAVLDSWVNYRARFGRDESAFPDCIAVMDVRARDEMVQAGFDAARLVVTGQPAFDDLACLRAAFTPFERERVRATWGASEADRVILFVSQPFSALSADKGWPSQGFDERVVFEALVEAVAIIADRTPRSIVLVVRPHPREQIDWIHELKTSWPRTVVARDADPRSAVLSADLVTGMNSILLMEACLMECVTLSLQPGLAIPDVLPTNMTGQSRAVYTIDGVAPAVGELLLDEDARARARSVLRRFAPPDDAAARVAELARHMLRRPAALGGVS